MRANPRTRICQVAHTHAHIRIYTHVRTYTRTRRKFSDTKSALQHCQTEFHHQSDTIHFYYPIAVQSISMLAPHWLHHLYKLSATIVIWHPLSSVFQLSANNSIISRSSLIYYHCRPSSRTVHPRIIFYLYPITTPTHHLINMSVCYKTLSILYILAAFSSMAVSHLIQITCFTNPTIIIFIMETVIWFNHLQSPLCIIIHLLIFVMKFILNRFV